eukprot:CAMPEP_0197596358 /NCGR_PEP_ID=MMETSP1326-20131121/24894_1 /TAXON_ID=1155430 /ORGANISM="Genus nov. species nov., Strain RCC2288" /LENGTH=371 /DNA_ID=CAMNT_0043162841 /DNA_START=29 /DNA_END=1140 /DNA_ORIENTATION=+
MSFASITEQAERAVANARFSTYGKRFIGPRLPIKHDYSELTPELIYSGVQAAKCVGRVIEQHGQVPPGTLAIIAANVIVFLLPDGVAFGEVCLNPHAVLHMRQLDRVVKSAFVHRDLFHLLPNMTGLLEDGAYLESLDGTANFLTRTAALLCLSQGMLVGLSSAERRLTGRWGRSEQSWFNDAVSNLTGRRVNNAIGSNELLPFYTSGVVGFSGVNYALKVAACHRRQPGSRVLMFGIIPVPVRYSVWFELAVGTLISPSGGTFAAHFAGTLAGLISVYGPRMTGIRIGRFGRPQRSYSGTGNRLGGRTLRDDEAVDPRGRPIGNRPVRSGNAREAERGIGGVGSTGMGGGGGHRLGDGSSGGGGGGGGGG